MTMRNPPPYRRIRIWENKRRVELLRRFRGLVAKYEEERQSDGMGDVFDTEESLATRKAINHILDAVDGTIDETGLSTTITWTPPPAVGGYLQHVPVITNLFHLHDYQIPLQTALDFADRAIGIHERDRTAAWLRTINPLYWLGLAFDYLADLPFRFARRAGFSTEKVQKLEDSWLGRLLKFLVWLIGAAGTLAGLLKTVGLLDRVLTLVGMNPPAH